MKLFCQHNRLAFWFSTRLEILEQTPLEEVMHIPLVENLKTVKSVLITDEVDDKCVAILEQNGFNVTKNTKLSREELQTEIKVSGHGRVIEFFSSFLLLNTLNYFQEIRLSHCEISYHSEQRCLEERR